MCKEGTREGNQMVRKILTPYKDEDSEAHMELDFVGNYEKVDTQSRETVHSIHGYIIIYN